MNGVIRERIPYSIQFSNEQEEMIRHNLLSSAGGPEEHVPERQLGLF